MVHNELVAYIKTEIARGVDQQELVNSLIAAGWKDTDVQDSLVAVTASRTVTPSLSSVNSTQRPSVVVTEKDYPIAVLWIFKAPLIIVFVSVIAYVVGFWFPLLVIAFPFYLIGNPLIRANFHYFSDERYFNVKQGVISKKQRNLPYGVIQNVIVKQDLFDRIFNLATLSIENASDGGGKGLFSRKQTNSQQGDSVGSSGNKVNIPGMRKSDAEALKQIILAKMKQNPLGDSQSRL